MTYAEKKARAEIDKREKERAEQKKVAELLKEHSFPSLSAVPVCPPKTSLTGYASLAAEWQEADNKKAEEFREAERLREKDEAELRFIMPNFYNRKHFEEPVNSHLPLEEALEETSAPPVEDEWKTVQRKAYKPKKPIEYPDELSPEEEESYDSRSDDGH